MGALALAAFDCNVSQQMLYDAAAAAVVLNSIGSMFGEGYVLSCVLGLFVCNLVLRRSIFGAFPFF